MHASTFYKSLAQSLEKVYLTLPPRNDLEPREDFLLHKRFLNFQLYIQSLHTRAERLESKERRRAKKL